MEEMFSNIAWPEILISGIVGALFSLLIARLYKRLRQTPSEYELWVEAVPHPMLSRYGTEFQSKFEFQVAQNALSEPVLVDFYLWSAGTRDIPEDNFDQGHPFIVDFGCPIAYVERIDARGAFQQ